MHSNPSANSLSVRPYKSLTKTQAVPDLPLQTSRSNFKFKPDQHINCYNFGNLPTFGPTKKNKLELPPIFPPIQLPNNPQSHCPTPSSRPLKRKTDSTFQIRHLQTERVHYESHKPTPSIKSTSNQSKTKSFSSEEVQELKEWETLNAQTAPQKFTQNTLTMHYNQDLRVNRLRQKNMEKCLIGHSKHLPFSLEKKRVSKRLSFGQNFEENRDEAPFELNLSKIMCKRESNNFLDDETQGLTVLLC